MTKLPLNADAFNALYSAQGALVISLAAVLSADQKTQLCENLARMARSAEANGDTLLETVLLDLYRAASL